MAQLFTMLQSMYFGWDAMKISMQVIRGAIPSQLAGYNCKKIGDCIYTSYHDWTQVKA